MNRTSGGPRSGMAQGWAREWWGTEDAGIPSIGAEGVAGGGQGSRSFSCRVRHLDPYPPPASGRARRRDGIPASAPPFMRAEQLPSCCPRAVRSATTRHPNATRTPACKIVSWAVAGPSDVEKR